jgi:uncharacterized protein (DUF302 family)
MGPVKFPEGLDERQGIIRIKSKYTVKESLDRFQELLRAKGITIYARIDQQEEARKVGSQLPPIEILIFGNPRAGSILMSASSIAALDLPLKLLAWADSDSVVWLSYNDPSYIGQRYGLPDSLVKQIDFGVLVGQLT